MNENSSKLSGHTGEARCPQNSRHSYSECACPAARKHLWLKLVVGRSLCVGGGADQPYSQAPTESSAMPIIAVFGVYQRYHVVPELSRALGVAEVGSLTFWSR